jgi:hypothetical protein
MLKRIFLVFISLLILSWVVYVSLSLIDKKNDFDITQKFGIEDGQILIINKKQDVNKGLAQFKTEAKNKEVLFLLLPHIQECRIVISANRRQLMFETKENWTRFSVKELLEKSGLTITSYGMNSFSINGYEVDFYQNFLFFHQLDIKTTPVLNWSYYDKRSSNSFIDFTSGEALVKDIYFRGENKIEYLSRNLNNFSGNQVNDKETFASILPKSFDSYHFIEREFFKNIEGNSSNTLLEWMDKGFVRLKIKEKQVIISDFKAGQNPIDIMFDKIGQPTSNENHAYFDSINLLTDFSRNGRIYMYLLNSFVVISEDENLCAEIVTQCKLGNTLSTDTKALQLIFGELPSKVSERKVNSNEKYSKSVYKNRLLETHLIKTQFDEIKENVTNSGSLTINVGASIKDFIAFNGKGNAAVLTATNELIYFSGGKIQWLKNLGSKSVGDIAYLDNLQLIVVTCKNSVHILDKAGNYMLGGAVNVSNSPNQQVTVFQWKNKLFFAYPDESGNLVTYNSNGVFYQQFSSGLTGISAPMDIWVSQNKLFYGVRNTNQFKMFDAERKAEHRTFTIPIGSTSIVESNVLSIFANENSSIVKIDQRGEKQNIEPVIGGKLYKSVTGSNTALIAVARTNSITLLDATGYKLFNVSKNFNKVDFAIGQQFNGDNYLSVIDGIENNVYLYTGNGRPLINRSFEGSKKSLLNLKDGKLILTTIVDDYLIQYDIED